MTTTAPIPDMYDRLQLLQQYRHVAIVGVSADPYRHSHLVAIYLQAEGYDIIPINPSYAGQTLLSKRVYATLTEAKEVGEQIEVVDIFRFFFQAEDGIRDLTETGVQTCALPISVRSRDLGIAPERLLQDGLDPVQRGGGRAFRPDHQHRLSVAGAHQPPPVRKNDADAVDIDHVVAPFELPGERVYDLVLAGVGTRHPHLRRRVIPGDVRGERRERAPRAGEDPQQPARRVDRVIVSVVLVGEEHVAGHLARKDGPDLAHAGLDERVAGLGELGPAPQPPDLIDERLGTLHLHQRDGPGVGGEDLPPVHHHQEIAPEHLPLIVHDADPVAVAVEAEPHVGALFPDHPPEVDQVFGIHRIRMVVREGGIQIAVERGEVDLPRPQDLRDERAGRAVSAVRHDPEPAGPEPDPLAQHARVGGEDLARLDRARAAAERRRFRKFADLLDLRSVQRPGAVGQ